MYQNQRPVASLPQYTENRPVQTTHQPHKFIPSPQFHRPPEQKPQTNIRPTDVDYELEGIQTEAQPGQYVIFSKPQISPELNQNKLKKKPEISQKEKISHFQDNGNRFPQETQDHVIFNPKEGQFYQGTTVQKPLAPEKQDNGRPLVYGKLPESKPAEGELPLQLVPPSDTQTEKPFDRNYLKPEFSTKESAASYPRPHWEKNGKPSFLFNQGPNKNDLNRPAAMPPQMVGTLVPPNGAPPQRFRRPGQPQLGPNQNRKNFNEASTNVKPKPNLPNILPQFRPTMKVGSGPYYRPSVYGNPNRRNGMNRYQNKEHGNFPYHIQYPDKDSTVRYEATPEIVPKFITNRGKLPSEVWNNNGMQKRFGQGPTNMQSMLERPSYPPQGIKVLKRLERTPVTTLQMLKQIPGVQTQRVQITREDGTDPSPSLVPPIYRTYVDEPKTEENLYIVYPAKAPQKLQPENSNVFIVSDSKSQKKFYNFTNLEEQQPILNSNKRINQVIDNPKNEFPYGFVKPYEKIQSTNESEGAEEEVEAEEDVERDDEYKEHKGQSKPNRKEESIDMNLHLQSNNQWNEVGDTHPKTESNDYYRFVEKAPQNVDHSVKLNPPSEYRTSISEGQDSAFTLGTVMHTVPEENRKGQIVSVPLNGDQKKAKVPQLNINERISNGKIITVSMPLDVKENQGNDRSSDNQSFQAPFQASSSVDMKQGWTVVNGPDSKIDVEEEKSHTTEESTTRFNFENFKPELIGGFKPLYELPEEPEDTKSQEKTSEREEKTFVTR